MEIEDTSKDIFYSSAHWKAPFNTVVSIKKGIQQEIILSLVKRITAVVVAIIAGLLSFGLGAIPAFYSLTADFKARKLCKLTLNSYDMPTGLTNFGCTCWFNSALKFIATSRFFDSAFSEQAIASCPPRWKNALLSLIEVVKSLRKGKSSEVDTSILKKLLSDLDGLFPHLDVKNRQLDPFDLILPLLELVPDLDHNEESDIQIMQNISSPDRPELLPRFTIEHDRTLQLSLNCATPSFNDFAESAQGQIELATLTEIERTKVRDRMNRQCYDALDKVYKEEKTVNFADLLNEEEILSISDGQSLSLRKSLVHAPQTMLVNFQRVTQNFSLGKMLKTHRAIDIKAEPLPDDPASHYYTLAFPEYDQDVLGISGSAAITPTHMCTYRIKGATRHLGGPSAGHWIFYDCTEDGKVFCHNDSKVYYCPHTTALKELAQGSLLKLELIRREPYQALPRLT